jgi:predicted ArsR family transcriptional regulator
LRTVNDILLALQPGWPMTQESITKAVNGEPMAVREQLFKLLINGDVSRHCGIGRRPAWYSITQAGAMRLAEEFVNQKPRRAIA